MWVRFFFFPFGFACRTPAYCNKNQVQALSSTFWSPSYGPLLSVWLCFRYTALGSRSLALALEPSTAALRKRPTPWGLHHHCVRAQSPLPTGVSCAFCPVYSHLGFWHFPASLSPGGLSPASWTCMFSRSSNRAAEVSFSPYSQVRERDHGPGNIRMLLNQCLWFGCEPQAPRLKVIPGTHPLKALTSPRWTFNPC